MNTTERAKLRARLKALLAKTVENGCTEAEAMAAAEKAAQLMREHAFTDEEIAIVTASMPRGASRMNQRDRLWGIISYVTNTALLYSYDSRTFEPVVVFYGNDPWPEVAVYLRDICNRAIDEELKVFRKTAAYQKRRSAKTRRKATAEFTQGMIRRLAYRLQQLFNDTVNAEQKLIAYQAAQRQHPDAGEAKTPKSKEVVTEAYLAGYDAGANVGLHHGVGGTGETLKIGGAA